MTAPAGSENERSLAEIAHHHPAYLEIETGSGGDHGAVGHEAPHQGTANRAGSGYADPHRHRYIVSGAVMASRSRMAWITLFAASTSHSRAWVTAGSSVTIRQSE